MMTATATEVQNNFGRFLKMVQEGQEVVILKNGKEVARLVSKEQSGSLLSHKLVGVLSSEPMSAKEVRAERLKRYENPD